MSASTTPHAWHMPRAAVFLAIVEHGSMSAAATALGVARSVVSSHLKQLESVCGARLLERSTRRLRLTEAGERFLPYAQRSVTAWADGLDEIMATMSEPAGTLTVTAPTILGEALQAAIVEYVRLYPKVQIRLSATDRMIDLIAEGVDLGLRAGALPDSSLVARKLGEDSSIMVAAPALVERLGAPERPQQLLRWPWVRHGLFSARRHLMGPEGEEMELSQVESGVGDSAVGLLVLLRAGVGAAILPRLSVRRELESGELVHILPGWHTDPVPLYAVFPSREYLPPKTTRFVEILQPALGNLLVVQ